MDPIEQVDGKARYILDSWRDFSALVCDESIFPPARHFIWRGQRCANWPLQTSLDRLLGHLGKLDAPSYARDSFATRHLEKFRYAVRGRRGANPARLESENEWWALGQHYGLATPLLDWSHSPFAAAYFAFEEIGQEQTPYRSVYALNRRWVEVKCHEIANGESIEGRMPVIEFVDPLSDENPRLVNQGGLFTRTPIGQSVEDWITNAFDGENAVGLVRIDIPDSDRVPCLRTLHRMNINQLSLFPDLTGASRYANLTWQLE